MGAGLLRTQAELEGGADHGVAAQGRGPAFAINYTFTDTLPICKAAMQMLFVTSTLQVTFAHVGCFRVEKAGNNKCRTCVQMVTTENALRPECPGVPGKDNLGRLDLVWKTRKGTPRKCKSQSAQRGRKSDIKEGTCP